MLSLIKSILLLLTVTQRKQFIVLQFLMILMASFELISIMSIGPFMAVIAEPSLIDNNVFFQVLSKYVSAENSSEFIYNFGLFVLVLLTLSSLLSMFTTWRLSIFASEVGAEISNRLYKYYMHQNWLFFSSQSSAELIKKVASESLRVSDEVMHPLVQLNAKVVLALFISVGLFIFNPLVAVVGLLFFASAYIVLYWIVRRNLEFNGQKLTEIATERFRLMNEGFGGVKDLLVLNRKKHFVNSFQTASNEFARARGSNLALSLVPRYFMELVAFGGMIGLILYFVTSEDQNLGIILPIISVYALAAFKLLPALQHIYVNFSQIKGAMPAFYAIKDDIEGSKRQDSFGWDSDSISESFNFKKDISLIDVEFSYPGKNSSSLNHINLYIPINNVVGFVGGSGAGKSTIIDVILGILTPQKGCLAIDGKPVNQENIKSWQKLVGFVPQSIFLSEGTVAENVAFGLPKSKINSKKVVKALKLAHLEETVNKLPKGIDTKIGERGVQLSGGQRQRLGIARALYDDPSVLVFDEATSALDGLTEKFIMESISEFQGKKTIIMIAHRLKTVRGCDCIYHIENGEVIAEGDYDYLVHNDESFKRMSEHA